MPDYDSALPVYPIGFVSNGIAGGKYGDWDQVESQLRLRPDLAPALEGIDEFSHVQVTFYADRSHPPDEPRIHPRDRPELPLVGYLATRTPNRPNPIAITVCELLRRDGANLMVRGLDAFDGTPIVDVKPYVAAELSPLRYPAWMRQLMEEGERSQERR